VQLRRPGRRADQDATKARIAADGLDDRDRRFGMADQEQQGRGALPGKLVTERGKRERVHLELDDAAATQHHAVLQDTRSGGPVDARHGCHGDPPMAGIEQEVGIEPPAARLRRGDARDPIRRLLGEPIENRRGAEERQPQGIGPRRSGAGDDAVVLPGKGDDVQAGQFIDRGHRLPRIGGSVAYEQLEQPSIDTARVIDLGDGEFDPRRADAGRPSTQPGGDSGASAPIRMGVVMRRHLPGDVSVALCWDRADGRQ
jgi:hypothetical protein